MNQDLNILIVSDLHLSAGRNPTTGKTSRLEDFFRDDAFARFLHYHEGIKDQPRFGGRPWLLILNGDIFDFLQVLSLPPEGRPLRTVKGVESHNDLRPHERTYGLGTAALESAWKLKQIARGHPNFFAALGWFVARGNHIAVIRGNHDAELHWHHVQDCFILETNRARTQQWSRQGGDPPAPLRTCRERIHFYPWLYYEPERIYVEHGGQYDPLNHFRDLLNPVLPNDPQHIELPWGSLFVRYLFNRVEDIHPFADNIKPLTRYLSWAFRKDPIKTLQVLVGRGGTFLKALWLMGRKAVTSTLHRSDPADSRVDADTLPLPPPIVEQIQALAQDKVSSAWLPWAGALLRGLIWLLTLLIAGAFLGLAGMTLFADAGRPWLSSVYVAAALLAVLLRLWLSQSISDLLEQDELMDAAFALEHILGARHRVHVIAMGHNHRPALKRLGDTWYVNTGAWVRLYRRQGPIQGREALTFLRLAWDQQGPPELLRWDDAGSAPQALVLWDDAGNR